MIRFYLNCLVIALQSLFKSPQTMNCVAQVSVGLHIVGL